MLARHTNHVNLSQKELYYEEDSAYMISTKVDWCILVLSCTIDTLDLYIRNVCIEYLWLHLELLFLVHGTEFNFKFEFKNTLIFI